MAEDHDAEIAELEKQIEDIRPAMEQACNEFLETTAQHLAEQWPQMVDDAVKSNSGRIAEMTEDEIAHVKGSVNSLVANARGVVDEELVQHEPVIWPHLLPLDELESRMGRGSAETEISWVGFKPFDHEGASLLRDRVLGAGGRLGPIMHEAKLSLSGGAIHHYDKGWMLRRQFRWTPRMMDTSERYGELAKAMDDALSKLRATRREKLESRAQSRWDQA